MEKKINFALIGTGNIAHEHANSIKNIKNAKLFAIRSKTVERARDFAKIYNAKAFTDYEKLLKDENVDAVDIVNENYLHADYGIKAALSGKHVIVEKPIDISIKKAKKLIDVCKKEGVKLSVISQYRYNQNLKILKHAINSGTFGKLMLINVLVRWHRPKEYYIERAWRSKKKFAGGGALLTQAIHHVDIIRWLMGPVKSVIGTIGTLKHKIKVEDVGIATIKFVSGAIGNIVATTISNKNMKDRIEVYGERGSSILEGNKILDWNFRKNKLKSRIISKCFSIKSLKRGTIKNQIQDFVESINKNKEVKIGGDDGLNALKIVRAIYESNKAGKEVRIK